MSPKSIEVKEITSESAEITKFDLRPFAFGSNFLENDYLNV